MLSRSHPDRIRTSFDDHRLVARAGLLLPATPAHRLGLPELADSRLNLGDAPGRANTGDKMMTLVASARAGGDCIDDADALRTGAPPTSCGRRWGGYATLGPKGNSRCVPTAASIPTPWPPPAAGSMSASPSPSASTPACGISSRRYPKMPGRRFPTGWTPPPMWPRPPMSPSKVSRTPRRCGSSSGG